jgi:hypothetical protein
MLHVVFGVAQAVHVGPGLDPGLVCPHVYTSTPRCTHLVRPAGCRRPVVGRYLDPLVGGESPAPLQATLGQGLWPLCLMLDAP